MLHLALSLAVAPAVLQLPPAGSPGGQDPWPAVDPIEAPAETEAGALPPSVQAEPLGNGRWRCRFQLRADEEAGSVHLAGAFNGWNASVTPLARGGDGRWQVTVELESGVQPYKFVLDGERWIADPANPDGEDDGFEGRNSVLRLGALGRLSAEGAARGDGRVEAAALDHEPGSPLYRQRLSGDRWLVRYRTLVGDVAAVELDVRGRPGAPMARVLAAGLFEYWEVSLPGGEELRYTFTLHDGELRVRHPAIYQLGTSTAGGDGPFTTPDWAVDAVWYQVMLDRFRNGDPTNDPDPVRPWTSEWHTPSDFEGRDGQSFFRYYVFQRLYGGDLAGLRESLDYLAELGVNALYLNPIFQAPSHHKYNASSFLHVDEHFGVKGDYAAAAAAEDLLDPSTWTWTPTDRMFLDFLAEAHERGFRVILDGVFNHVGTGHPAFQDVRARGRESPYADWFDVRSWKPFRYAGWAGFGELPVFKKSADGFASRAVVEHLFAVTRRWMDPDGDGDPSDGIDGWRLDVPNEVPMPFWAEWRELVKSINPDAYITGEIWHRAEKWLDGRHFDAVMNYPFAAAAVAWIGNHRRKLTASELDRKLAELRLAYPAEATYALMNLAGSHDTDRLASMMKNPDREYDQENREQDGARYDAGRPGKIHYKRARLMALLQMTYVGAPMIYYGDEVGMWGADDPANRKPMLWLDLEPYDEPDENHVLEEQLAHFREVTHLRRAHSALRRGSFRTLLADDERDLWVFERQDEDETAVVALNASGRSARVEIPALEGDWESVYGFARRDRGSTVQVPPTDGRVWVRAR